MCIGIPMQIQHSESLQATCVHQGEVRRIDLTLVGEQPPGTWVMTFLDAAREVIDETTARQNLAAIEAVEQVMRGQSADIEALFADLIDREPELPPHLAVQVQRQTTEENP